MNLYRVTLVALREASDGDWTTFEFDVVASTGEIAVEIAKENVEDENFMSETDVPDTRYKDSYLESLECLHHGIDLIESY